MAIRYVGDNNGEGYRTWDVRDYHKLNEWWVVIRDRFSYEDMIYAKCSNADEAEIVADLKCAMNNDRHLTNPIETTYEVVPPPRALT